MRHIQEFAYRKLSLTLREKIWEVNLAAEDVKHLFKSDFWTDVLTAWCKLNFNPQENVNNFSNQIIWYNSLMRIQNKPYIIENAAKEGLMYVGQLINIEGGFISQSIICNSFHLTTLQYNSIIASMPKLWKNTLLRIPVIIMNLYLITKYVSRSQNWKNI